MDSQIGANVLGTTSAVCWSIQLLPQIVLNYRRHNATGLQPSMMMLWAWAGVPLGVYNIVSNYNIALQVQAQILAFLSLLTWAQVYYYEHKWPIKKCCVVAIPIGCVMGAIEFGLVIALRRGESIGTAWPVTLMAVLAALFLALGVLRHYIDIYIHRTVRGVSFTFCAIDALGDLTAILSIIFQPELDILGIVIYGVEFVLWCGIFAAGGYFNLRFWVKLKYARRDQSRSIIREPSTHNNLEPSVRLQRLGIHLDGDSSTSVFRTASNDVTEARQRRVQASDRGGA